MWSRWHAGELRAVVGGRESGGAVFVAFRVFYARWVQRVALSAAVRVRGLIKALTGSFCA